MKNKHKTDEISAFIWGVIITITLYLIIPSILILEFADKENGLFWVIFALIVLTIAILITLYIMASFGILNKRLTILDFFFILLTDTLILIVLGMISIFISLFLLYLLIPFTVCIGFINIGVFIKDHLSMIIIFLTFFIQLSLFYNFNKIFKVKLINKFFKNEDTIDYPAYLKIYQSTLITKVYTSASIFITVILLGLSKDYANVDDTKKLFFDGPYVLLIVALSIYVMNTYLIWIAPNKKPLIGIELLDIEKEE